MREIRHIGMDPVDYTALECGEGYLEVEGSEKKG